MDDFVINFNNDFKSWLKENGLDENAKYKWWNIDTSFISMLNIFKNIKTKTVNFVKMTHPNEKLNYTKNKIYIKDLKKEISFAAVHQHIRTAIFFGAIELNENFKNYKYVINFIQDWVDKKIELKLNENYLKADNYINYLFDNIDYIKKNFIDIVKNYKKSFIYKDCYNILFDLFFFNAVSKKEIQEKKSCENDKQIENIIDFFRKSKRTDIKSWKLLYDSNRYLSNFNSLLFDEREITQAKCFENKNEMIGQIGEYLFNIFSENIYNKEHEKLHLIEKIDHNSVRLLPFKKIEWISKCNKYSEYDFKIDKNYFEIKSTTSNAKKNSFIISNKEWEHMNANKDYSYLCLIKNIKIDEIKFDKNDLKLFKDLQISFLDANQIETNYKLTMRGYWATQY